MWEALTKGWTNPCGADPRSGDDSESTIDLPRPLSFTDSTGASTRAQSLAAAYMEEVVQVAGDAITDEAMEKGQEVMMGIPEAMLASFDKDAMTGALGALGDAMEELTEGLEFHISLALPIEWMGRVCLNAGISVIKKKYNGTEVGSVLERMTTSKLTSVMRGVQTLLDQDKATAIDMFEGLVEKVPIALEESSNKANFEDVKSDAQECRQCAERAYHNASSTQDKLLITSLLCNVKQMEAALEGVAPRQVRVDLVRWIKRLLNVSQIQSDLRGGQLDLLLGGEAARHERLRMLVSILVHAERYAKVHGLEPLIYGLPEELRINVHAVQLCCGSLFPEEAADGALTADENFIMSAFCRAAGTCEVRQVRQVCKFEYAVDEITVSSNGKTIFTASRTSEGTEVAAWAAETGLLLQTASSTKKIYGPYYLNPTMVDPNEAQVEMKHCSEDGRINQAKKEKPRKVIQGHGDANAGRTSIRVAPRGQRALLLRTSNTLLDVQSSIREIKRMSFNTPKAMNLSRVQFSWDGSRALVSMRDGDTTRDEELTMWDLQTGRELFATPLQHVSAFAFLPTEAGTEFVVGTGQGDVFWYRTSSS